MAITQLLIVLTEAAPVIGGGGVLVEEDTTLEDVELGTVRVVLVEKVLLSSGEPGAELGEVLIVVSIDVETEPVVEALVGTENVVPGVLLGEVELGPVDVIVEEAGAEELLVELVGVVVCSLVVVGFPVVVVCSLVEVVCSLVVV
jgi:hypothetical protein